MGASESRWTGARKLELPSDWEARRKRRLEEDGYRCQWPRTSRPEGICGAPATDVDHWVHRDDHRHESLKSLCGYHHRGKTQQESAESRRKIAAKGRMPVERHPGLG